MVFLNLTFSWIELQMLLRCCLIHNHHYTETLLYVVYMCPYLGLALFMSGLCYPFFIFILIFIVINDITSFKQTCLFFLYIFKNISDFFWMITRMRKENNFQIAKVQPQGVAKFLLDFFQFQPGLAYKSVAYKKKSVYFGRKV